MRIIRSFLNETAIPKLTNDIMSVYKTMFIVCLIANFIVECIIVILLECLISQRLLVINTKVGLFSYFLD